MHEQQSRLEARANRKRDPEHRAVQALTQPRENPPRPPLRGTGPCNSSGRRLHIRLQHTVRPSVAGLAARPRRRSVERFHIRAAHLHVRGRWLSVPRPAAKVAASVGACRRPESATAAEYCCVAAAPATACAHVVRFIHRLTLARLLMLQ
eukprot:3147045-Prymnesium_polylepis.1